MMSLGEGEGEQADALAVSRQIQPRADVGEMCAVSALCAFWVAMYSGKKQQLPPLRSAQGWQRGGLRVDKMLWIGRGALQIPRLSRISYGELRLRSTACPGCLALDSKDQG